MVSQLDQLKAKIARERKTAAEKKRARRPVLENRPVNYVASAVNKFLKTRQDERGINNPRLKDGPADIVELFKPFDTNQDGRLSYPDFKKGLKGLNLGLTSEECETFAQWVDQDGDCVIDTNELHERLQAHGDGEQNPTVPATPSDKADSSFRSPPPPPPPRPPSPPKSL